MATITFFNNQQPLKLENIAVAQAAMESWAAQNGFESVSLHLEAENKLFVQFDTGVLLSSWLDLHAVERNDTEALEEQLDFARGEFRRRAAGYGQFDR